MLHTHTEACSVDGELVCQLPEVKEHSHGDSCWETRKAAPVLLCENAEEDHVHGEDCYAVPLSCDIPVSEEHSHEDACYQTETVLACTVPEIKAHSHSVECEGGCGMIEVAVHIHGEDCFETQEIPVDTENLTCQIPEGEEHTHGDMCYGTWVLECQLEEHTHTENCEPKQELTEEELAQVDAVIQQIDTLETTEQVEAKLAEYEAAEDWEGYETYREEAAQKTQAIRDSYNVLSDAQKQKVTNAAKLTQLDWLVPMATLEEEENTNKGEIKDWLDGDHAYINVFKVDKCVTGTAEWDADDKPGNDSSEANNILRTFDEMSYTLEFGTKLRDAKAQENVGGYRAGRVYFEFILPVSKDQAQFETGSMDFLQTAPNIQYVLDDVEIDGVACQVLRGSFTLEPTQGNAAAIGASTSQVGVVIRALKMKNGDKLQPIFTMWLQYNDVGVTYDAADDRIPVTIVAGNGHSCGKEVTKKDGEVEKHDIEAVTCEGAEAITISARTMLNIAVLGNNSVNVNTGTYEFGTAELEGRILGAGFRIELRGKEGQGMRGVEFPEEGSVLSFEVDMSSKYDPVGEALGPQDVPDYQVRFWTGGGNYYDNTAAASEDTEISGYSNQTGRQVSGLVGSDRIALLPANWKLDGAYFGRSCYDGGKWIYTPIEDEAGNIIPGKFRVTVSDFVVIPELNSEGIDNKMLQKMGYFPYSYVSGNEKNYTYYNPDTIKNYWDIQQAVFSAGEFWLMQPHEALSSTGGKIHITEAFQNVDGTDTQGQFNTHIEISNVMMGTEETGMEAINQMEPADKTNDNEQNWGLYLKRPGTIDGRVVLLKDETRVYNNSLTDGCEKTDEDWATTGSGVTLGCWLIHDGAEGEYTGVAYNDLLKFDDRFFTPDPDWDPNNSKDRNVDVHSNGTGAMHNFLWAALPDGGGWDSEDHMKQATPDDLVFFASLAKMEEKAQETGINYVAVGVMLETRGVCNVDKNNHFLLFVDGTIHGEAGQVYMITRCSYAWQKRDVAEAARKYHNTLNPDNQYTDISQLTDEDYNKYVKNEKFENNEKNENSDAVGFPSRAGKNDIDIGNKGVAVDTEGATDRIFSKDDPLVLAANTKYPKPFWRQDYNYAQRGGSLNADGGQKTTISALRDCKKATYENGVYTSGKGAHFYQDSCLVVPYKTQVIKTTAQIESSTKNAKQVYDMSQNQRTVDYQLNASIVRAVGKGDSTGADLTTTVYIEDTLPVGLTYVKDSARYGGTYKQNPYCQKPGTVTGGIAFNTQEYPDYVMTVIGGGTGEPTILRWEIPVTTNKEDKNALQDLNGTIRLPSIYYSCTIGNAGADNDVKDKQELVNKVKIWAVGPDSTTNADDDDYRPIKAEYGNLDSYSIRIQKTSAVSLAKISDFLVVDKGEPFGFTMTVGNNSGEEKKNTVIVESLPIDGLNRTDFTGRLVVSEFTAELVNAGTAKLADKLTFYYTTSEEYAGKLSSDILAMAEKNGTTIIDWLAPQVEDEIWKSLTFDTSADNKLPSVTEQEGWNTYESGVDKKYKQITAILAVGDLPAGATLKMHITIQLPDGEAKDYMVNYLSQDESLTSYARAQMVNRTLEGLTWLDSDRDGVQDSSEEKISGVKVSLLKLNEGLKSVDNYVPVCYPGTQTPIQIQTGQTISFLAEAGTTPTSYNEGCYQFTDLPAGTYAVEFTSGSEEESITYLVASPVDNAGDDAKDSDGVPTYSSDKKRLEKTRIEGIVMPEAYELTYGEHISPYHDSGFYYRDVELPSTGGMGTILFYVIGG
ncbi:MAG: hypothetical protein U0L15_08155, partial [Oscillospiraceae bacterium]|nr:hypothetical protein [Oscillospiraceae bacterium]